MILEDGQELGLYGVVLEFIYFDEGYFKIHIFNKCYMVYNFRINSVSIF